LKLHEAGAWLGGLGMRSTIQTRLPRVQPWY
jgi:hypothetical protein